MKRALLFVFLGIFALATMWFLGQQPPFHREQVPGIPLDDFRNSSPFVAKFEGVRYGPTTGSAGAPYEYLTIFLKKGDGRKLGVIDYKPDTHTLEILRSLKEGSNYDFPAVLSRAHP